MKETSHLCLAASNELERLLPPNVVVTQLDGLRTVRTADATCQLCGKILRRGKYAARRAYELTQLAVVAAVTYALSIPLPYVVIFVLPFVAWLGLRDARRENARLRLVRDTERAVRMLDDGDQHPGDARD